MKRRPLALFAVALTAALVLGGCAATTTQESGDSAAIAARAEAWEVAFNAGDVDTLVSFYTEDARVMPPGGEAGEGPEAFRAVFLGFVDAGLGVQLDTVRLDTSGDIGHHVGTYAVMAGDEVVDGGNFIETWRKVGGEWMLTGDIWNSDRPPAATTSLVIAHDVADPAVWLAAWHGGEGSRQELFAAHGVPSVTVLTNPDQPNRPALLLEVADMAAFEALLASPEGQAAAAADGVQMDSMVTWREE